MAKKFVRVCHNILWKNPNRLFGQPNTMLYVNYISIKINWKLKTVNSPSPSIIRSSREQKIKVCWINKWMNKQIDGSISKYRGIKKEPGAVHITFTTLFFFFFSDFLLKKSFLQVVAYSGSGIFWYSPGTSGTTHPQVNCSKVSLAQIS